MRTSQRVKKEGRKVASNPFVVSSFFKPRKMNPSLPEGWFPKKISLDTKNIVVCYYFLSRLSKNAPRGGKRSRAAPGLGGPLGLDRVLSRAALKLYLLIPALFLLFDKFRRQFEAVFLLFPDPV